MPYLGKSLQYGDYSKLDDFSGDFDGSDATHAVASNGVAITPVNPQSLIISINGVIQEPTTDYTVSGTNITFTTAPTSGDNFFGVAMGEQLDIGTPSDSTVTSAKLASTFFTGATDIGAAIVDADLILVDDGAGGTLRKTAASRIKTYAGTTIANNTNNYVATATGTGLNGEANLTFDGNALVVKGTAPSITIGDADAEDAKIVFDGNAQDFHIGLDDTADSLAIGLGSALGTTDHMVFDPIGAVTKPLQPAFYAWASGANTVATGATTELAWTNERFDINADFDLAGERFTAPVAGVYLLQCTISSVYGMGTTDGGRISLYLYKNGSLHEDFGRMTCAVGVDFAQLFSEHFMSGTLIENAAADDYYEVFGHNTTGATITYNYTQGYGSFSGVLLG